MSNLDRFVDEYAPAEMPGWPCVSTPVFSTILVEVDSGYENASRRWQHPLWEFLLPEAVRTQAVFEAVLAHWLVMGGSAHIWPFRDPLDFASAALAAPNTAPALARTDQAIGTTDGTTSTFQLAKSYTRGATTYARRIELPVAATVVVGLNGADPASLDPPLAFEVSRPGGVVAFSAAPPSGLAVTAGFLFDVPVRFEDDRTFAGIARTYGAGGFADIPLVERRLC